VLKTAIEISAAQIATFAKFYPMNARPIQPLHGREVRESESSPMSCVWTSFGRAKIFQSE
jgi:hypothetical protein